MPTIVFPRTFPDLDGAACAVAYAELLKHKGRDAIAWIPTEGDSEAEFVLGKCPDLVFADPRTFAQDSEFILVDASDLEGFPEQADRFRVVEVIDHRFHGEAPRAFPNATIAIERVGAAATIVAERFRIAEIQPSRSSQQLLYGAIHSNTQRLRGSVTTDRDRDAAGWLEEMQFVDSKMLDDQFGARRDFILSRLEESVARESKTYSKGLEEYVVAQLEFEGASKCAQMSEARLLDALAVLGPRSMLNLVDVASGTSILLVPNATLRATVAQRLGVAPTGVAFSFVPALLRKQIVAALADPPAA